MHDSKIQIRGIWIKKSSLLIENNFYEKKNFPSLSPSLSCSNESNSSRKGTRLIDEIRSGSSRNSLRHQFLFASIFFFSFTREENCSVITDIPSGRGDEYNGGILFVVSIYEFSSNDNSPPGGRREQRPPFFFSLSLLLREAVREEESTIERPNLEEKGI